MENSILFMILLQVFLILLNAVFASAEIAVISINDAKLARMAAEGDKGDCGNFYQRCQAGPNGGGGR